MPVYQRMETGVWKDCCGHQMNCTSSIWFHWATFPKLHEQTTCVLIHPLKYINICATLPRTVSDSLCNLGCINVRAFLNIQCIAWFLNLTLLYWNVCCYHVCCHVRAVANFVVKTIIDSRALSFSKYCRTQLTVSKTSSSRLILKYSLVPR